MAGLTKSYFIDESPDVLCPFGPLDPHAYMLGTYQLLEKQQRVGGICTVAVRPVPGSSPDDLELSFGRCFNVGVGILDIKMISVAENNGSYLCLTACADKILRVYWVIRSPSSSDGRHCSFDISLACISSCMALDGESNSTVGLSVCFKRQTDNSSVINIVTSSSDGSIGVADLHVGASAVGSSESSVRFENIRCFKAHNAECWTTCFANLSPRDRHKRRRKSGGDLILSGADDCVMKLWDLSKIDTTSTSTQFPLKANTKSHTAGITCITFLHNHPKLFFTGCYDELIRLWNIDSFQNPLSTYKAIGGIWRMRQSFRVLTPKLPLFLQLSIASTYSGASSMVFTFPAGLVYSCNGEPMDSTTSTDTTNIVCNDICFYKQHTPLFLDNNIPGENEDEEDEDDDDDTTAEQCAHQRSHCDNIKLDFYNSRCLYPPNASTSDNVPGLAFVVDKSTSCTEEFNENSNVIINSSPPAPRPPGAQLLVYDINSTDQYDLIISFYEKRVVLLPRKMSLITEDA